MFDTDDISKKRLHDFLAKTAILFTHKELHEILIAKLTGEDWYYLNDDGTLLTNSYTPDGNYVDETGIWIPGK